MGMTLQHLEQTMTGQEFGLHYALEQEEPLPAAQWSVAAALLAAQANGPLKPPAGARIWQAGDFMPALWQEAAAAPQPAPAADDVSHIMARARAAGMVQ